MSGNVHQDDRTKLKALVYQTSPASLLCEPRQFIAAYLKATVTQLEKDRTVTNDTASNLKVEAYQQLEEEYKVVSGTAANMKAEVTQAAKDRTVTNATAANLKAEVYQATEENLQVTANQSNAPSLKATVTQFAKDRTITGTATVTQIPLSTMLSSAITLTSADTDYLLPASEQSGRSILVIYNISDATVYIGGSGVTTAAGMPLASSKYMVVPASANVYAVCGFAGKVLRLSECK